MRRIVTVLMAALLTLWAVPFSPQPVNADGPEEVITGPGELCTPVFTAVLVAGIVTTDLAILSNPSTTPAQVTATWFDPTGVTNATNFVMGPRTFAVTRPADVGFTAAGAYSVIVRALGGLFIAASVVRTQNGQIASQVNCLFIN